MTNLFFWKNHRKLAHLRILAPKIFHDRVTILIDGGSTHNFIDSTLIVRKGIPKREFGGFNVEMVNDFIMECNQKVPKVELNMGNYTMR